MSFFTTVLLSSHTQQHIALGIIHIQTVNCKEITFNKDKQSHREILHQKFANFFFLPLRDYYKLST